ncbi:MarR family transcriptional regulator [Micromonospora sp. RP3T]|uniref:MarR family transcriptional regulator n=1 Tax=Micromonospora sp. RP3T TaxID=2135446 RepID=UPI000D17970A|nr:MarR family transcriptional regulator [Micromonospora sp. RP3T]PTA45382.1 MarR family transcriptional regulator [Micromonospora sp. RP3T]
MPRKSPPTDRTPPRPAVPDSVDRILAEWATERPDLPVTPIGVVTRLNRLRTRFDEELSTVFARYDLSAADFTVIAALRRAGVPYTLPQSVLMNRLGLTSGTVSVRLTRLVKKGIVDRRPSPEDARGTVVTLTERGVALFDDIAPVHLTNEEVLLSALTAPEQQQLADLLRKLLVGFEHQSSTSPLGMTLAPAHLARRMRSAVGLPDTPGLLITDVTPQSRADTAGLRPGDLLTSVDGTELRSCVTLAEALDGTSDVTISYLRGTDQHQAHLAPG